MQVLSSDMNDYKAHLVNSHGTPGGGKIFTGKISYTDEQGSGTLTKGSTTLSTKANEITSRSFG